MYPVACSRDGVVRGTHGNAAAARSGAVMGEGQVAGINTGPANLQSLRVAEKCGYGEPLTTTFAGEPTLLFTRWAS
jgi:hypothetical protein